MYKPPSLIGSGALLVGQTAFTDERLIDYQIARRARLTDVELMRFGLRVGDVLVSRVYATLDGVGQPAFVTDLNEPAVFESNMMRLRFDRTKVRPHFAFWTLQANVARAQIRRAAQLSNQASINQRAINSLVVALPPLAEQDRVCGMIDAVESRRRLEERILGGLRLLKQGLATDLLTGRVRVPMVEAAG